MAAREIFDLKQILGDLKLVWKKQKITLRPMGIIWQLFAFSFQPIWINEKRQTVVPLIPDSTIGSGFVSLTCIGIEISLGVRGTIGMLGEGNCMYRNHTALKWLVKVKIRTREGLVKLIMTYVSGLFFWTIFPKTKLIRVSKPWI